MSYLQLNAWKLADDGREYCTVNSCSLLLKMDIVNNDVELLLDFSEKTKGIFNACMKVDNFIFVFGDWSNEILKFDLVTQNIQKLSICDQATLGVFGVHYLNDKIYAYSGRRGKVYIIEPISFCVESTIEIEKATLLNIPVGRSCVVNNSIYLSGGDTGNIFVLDSQSLNVKKYKVFEGEKSISSVVVVGNRAFLGCKNDNKIYEYCLLDGRVKTTINLSLYGISEVVSIDEILFLDNKLWVTLNKQAEILVLSFDESKFDGSLIFSEYDDAIRRLNIIGKTKENIVIEDNLNRVYFAVELDSFKIHPIDLSISKEIYALRWKKERIVNETNNYNLLNFLECMS